MVNDETFLHERVQALAVFGTGHQPARLLKFKRASGQEVTVSELGLRWPAAHGTHTVHIFDVTDGGADYRLEFDAERLTWHLTMEADHYEA